MENARNRHILRCEWLIVCLLRMHPFQTVTAGHSTAAIVPL